MGVEPRTPGDFPFQESNSALSYNPEIENLLEKRDYDWLEHLLVNSLQNVKSESYPISSSLLTAARQLCQVCSDCRQQEEHFQQLQKAALIREHDLRQNLRSILILLDKITGLSVTEMGMETAVPAEALTPPNLWRRAKELLGFETASAAAGLESESADETTGVVEPEPPGAIDGPGPVLKEDIIEDIIPTMTVYCFGLFRVYVNDAPVENWTGNLSKSIFKYMLLHREHPIANDVLMDTFWPDAEPESARRNLYQAIYQIRQVFQPCNLDTPIILSSNGSYGINLDISIWLDCEEFMHQYEIGRQLVRKGHQRESAAAYEAVDSLHGGDFLAEELYEDWTFQMREHFRRVHLEILEKLSQFYYEHKRWALCISFAQRLLSEDKCNEEAHRILMQAYYYQGQRHLALKQYYRCVEVLQQELETEPVPETVELYQKIRQT